MAATRPSSDSDRVGGVPPDDGGLARRLAVLGMEGSVAAELLLNHPRRRIVDALDALQELRRRQGVFEPARWVRRAVVEGWDFSELLAPVRQAQARRARYRRRQARQDRQEARLRRRLARADGWAQAVADLLDDDQLEVAVAAVTGPVAGVGRRSVPMARAELVGWAVGVARRQESRPLADVLVADLAAGPSAPADISGELPNPPTTWQRPGGTLTERLRALFERRPDLLHPAGSEALERDDGPGRNFGPADLR